MRGGQPVPGTIRILATVFAVLAGGTGCINSRALSNRVVDYNVAAETARNQMLLLNVLRARDRMPMTFTGLTRITGSVRATSGIGVGGSANSQGSEALSGSASLGMTDAPTFDVAVLDSQQFMRGIMTPLRFDLVEYFWDQGFTREVLLYLVVERIEIECRPGSDEGTVELVNDPDEPTWESFRQMIHDVSDGAHWEADPASLAIGPPVGQEQVTALSPLIMVAGSNLQLAELADGTWQLERPTTTLRLVSPVASHCGPAVEGPGKSMVDLYDSKPTYERSTIRSEANFLRGRVVLRSPQSILFFLGELTRPGKVIHIRERSPNQPLEERRLFHVASAAQCAHGDVGVDYEGERYLIPDERGACHGGRSMQSLALAAQLLSLQQSASDLPVTNTVRIVGQ